MVENVFYVDLQGWDIGYFKGGNDMTVIYNGQVYHHDNGLMSMAVI